MRLKVVSLKCTLLTVALGSGEHISAVGLEECELGLLEAVSQCVWERERRISCG